MDDTLIQRAIQVRKYIPIALLFVTACSAGKISTPAVSNEPTISPSRVVFLTLPVHAARDQLLNLLSNNGNCYLPCLWGIKPGESEIRDIQEDLALLGSISNSTHLNSTTSCDIAPTYIDGDLAVYINVNVSANLTNGVLETIYFRAQSLQEISQGNYELVFGASLYDRLLEKFSLAELLTTYGKPRAILIKTHSEIPPQTWGAFNIMLLYPEKGVLIQYMMPMELNNTKGIIGCPGKSMVELFLVPANDHRSPAELLGLFSAPNTFEEVYGHYLPIQEATSLTLDDFVNKYQRTNAECIETPADLWLKP